MKTHIRKPFGVRAMITSDAQLETMKAAPSGEALKDDIAENSHPANGSGAPVLDGELQQPERPNVNAMREAIEAQDEMEVGKPVEDTQAEAEAESVIVDKQEVDGKTQIIINIAGKKKALTFSNAATAKAFVKGASVKFGKKFQVIAGVDDVYNPDINRSSIEPYPEDWKPEPPKTMPPREDKPVTSGNSDIDGGAPNLKSAAPRGKVRQGLEPARKPHPFVTKDKLFRQPNEQYAPQTSPRTGIYNIMVGDQYVMVAPDETYRIVPEVEKATQFGGEFGAEDAKQIAAEIKSSTMSGDNPVRVVPTTKTGASMKEAGFNYFFPGQVLENFYPELQHEIVDHPNATNSPMPVEMTGDGHVGQGQEGLGDNMELLPGAIEDAFEGMNRIGYVSTSPAGGMGIGRDGKQQVLEGAPLRKENDIRGPMFMEEFNAQYEGVPGAAIVLAKKAGADEKQQFSLFLKRVMGEVAATFLAAFKVTTRMPMNQIPGVGEIQLAQVEKPVDSAFNIVNTGSRVKYLMDKLTDSEIQDAINDAFAQGAVWHEAKEGGFVYEVFVRAETIDTESMILKYKFVTGTKEADSE